MVGISTTPPASSSSTDLRGFFSDPLPRNYRNRTSTTTPDWDNHGPDPSPVFVFRHGSEDLGARVMDIVDETLSIASDDGGGDARPKKRRQPGAAAATPQHRQQSAVAVYLGQTGPSNIASLTAADCHHCFLVGLQMSTLDVPPPPPPPPLLALSPSVLSKTTFRASFCPSADPARWADAPNLDILDPVLEFAAMGDDGLATLGKMARVSRAFRRGVDASVGCWKSLCGRARENAIALAAAGSGGSLSSPPPPFLQQQQLPVDRWSSHLARFSKSRRECRAASRVLAGKSLLIGSLHVPTTSSLLSGDDGRRLRDRAVELARHLGASLVSSAHKADLVVVNRADDLACYDARAAGKPAVRPSYLSAAFRLLSAPDVAPHRVSVFEGLVVSGLSSLSVEALHEARQVTEQFGGTWVDPAATDAVRSRATHFVVSDALRPETAAAVAELDLSGETTTVVDGLWIFMCARNQFCMPPSMFAPPSGEFLQLAQWAARPDRPLPEIIDQIVRNHASRRLDGLSTRGITATTANTNEQTNNKSDPPTLS